MSEIERHRMPRLARAEAEVERLTRERDYALRDAKLARERADRTHLQLKGAVEDLRKIADALDNAGAPRKIGTLSLSLVERVNLCAYLDGR